MSDTRKGRAADLADWLTKEQVAAALEVSTKAVESFAKARKLQQRMRKAGTGHARVVYCPEDVDRLKRDRSASDDAPFVVPELSRPRLQGLTSEKTSQKSSQTSQKLVKSLISPEFQTSQTSQKLAVYTSQKLVPPFALPWIVLTVRSAALISGWTATYLRRAIRDGRLPATKDRGWKIRLRDLAKL